MAASEPLPTPDELITETADVLRHFYDYPYLGRHPILRSLRDLLGDDPAVTVPKLRGLLLDTIEELRPSLPASNLACRPFEIVHSRFILGRELAELESELGLGERQIQREQQRAFAEIAGRLWVKKLAAAHGLLPGSDSLAQEIARAAGERRVFDALEQAAEAIDSVRALAERYDTALQPAGGAGPVPVLGDAALFRQLLVSALSLLIRSGAAAVMARLERQGTRVVCSLQATAEAGGETAPLRADDGISPVPLPAALVTLAEANGAEISAQHEAGGRRVRITLPAEGGEWTVVIVEDNEELAAVFSRYLSRHGYRVVEVNEPRSALEQIAAERPDAVVLDVMMSGVDGWQILQKLRVDPRLSAIPIAVCSVLDEGELALSLGADSYLRKPIKPAQLQECVARLLRLRHSGAAKPSSAAPPGA